MRRIASSDLLAGRSAIAAGAAFAAEGIVQLIHNQRDAGHKVSGLAAHLNLSLFLLGLLFLGPTLVALGRRGGTRLSRGAGVAAAGATAILALACLVSLIRGEDPGFFDLVAAATNLTWLGGLAIIGTALARNGRLPKAMAIALPLSWIPTLLLSGFGGGLVGGGYLIALGCLLVEGAEPGREISPVDGSRMAVDR